MPARVLLVLLVIACLGFITDPANAACVVPTPLPTVPIPPTFAGTTTNGSTIEVWREACLPGSSPAGIRALYMRITVHTPGANVCDGPTIIQSGQQINTGLKAIPGGANF